MLPPSTLPQCSFGVPPYPRICRIPHFIQLWPWLIRTQKCLLNNFYFMLFIEGFHWPSNKFWPCTTGQKLPWCTRRMLSAKCAAIFSWHLKWAINYVLDWWKYSENNQRQPRPDNCVQTAHGPNRGCNEGNTATADESDKKLRNKIILHN